MVVMVSACIGEVETEATELVLVGCGSAESELLQLAAIRARGTIRLSARR